MIEKREINMKRSNIISILARLSDSLIKENIFEKIKSF